MSNTKVLDLLRPKVRNQNSGRKLPIKEGGWRRDENCFKTSYIAELINVRFKKRTGLYSGRLITRVDGRLCNLGGGSGGGGGKIGRAHA